MHLKLIQCVGIFALSGLVASCFATSAQAQQIQTVFVISMENHNLTQPNPLSSPQQILGNAAAPYINSLMTPGNPNALHSSFAKNYQNVASGVHPSAPNYIWSQGGSNFGVLNDNDPFGAGGSAQTTPNNLSNYLQTAGISWKAYEEDIDINPTNNTVLPSNQWTVPLQSTSGTLSSGTNAYNGSNQYNYDVNHDPMVYFTDTNGGNNSTPSNSFAHNYAPLQQLQTDLTNNTVARYNWITPDLYNTAHSSLPNGFTYMGTNYTGDQAAVAQGDNFLSIIIPQIEASYAYQHNGVIIIWFDETEGGDTSAWTIPEIVISPLAKGNAYSNSLLYTHSSDILTTEEIFGVGPCIAAACSATDLSDLFQPGAFPSGLTLTSISPSNATQGSSVSVTLTGTGFVSPVTINTGSGISVSNVSVVSSTQITATFNIAANAPTGSSNVSVTTSAGTSGTTVLTVKAPVAAPVATPPAGSYSGTQSVALSDATSGTLIYYSVNGGTFTKYTTSISVAASETLQAVAILPVSGTSTYLTSPVLNAPYTISAGVATPILAPAGGTYNTPQNVQITDSTPNAVIYYSINGGTFAKYTGSITVAASETIQAVAVVFTGNSYTASTAVNGAFTIN